MEQRIFRLEAFTKFCNQAFASISSLDEFLVTLSPKAGENYEEKFYDESFVVLTKQSSMISHELFVPKFVVK